MAFLFIWQFLLSGPLEIASGLIAMAQFAESLNASLPAFNERSTWEWVLGEWADEKLTFALGPKQLASVAVGIFLLVLLYRRITVLGKLTVTFWLGVLAVVGWILVEGAFHFDPDVALDFSGPAAAPPAKLGWQLGAAMILAMYSYLGYYNVCYIGDEVRDPGRTLPRSILLSALLVCVLFVGLHLAMLGTVPWQSVPTQSPDVDNYSLAAAFMRRVHGNWAAVLVTLLLIWSCLGSVFAGLLGYSRIPYGAARYGHFFSVFGRIHPVHRIPHVSLLLIGGMTLFWCFFGLQTVISALITTRILEQFIAQIFGVMLLRARQPDRPRPFKMWLYPVPCVLALIGWLYVYVCARIPFILLGLATLAAGVVAFLIWSKLKGGWPFAGPDPTSCQLLDS
jgi:amino acid transporter